MRDKLKKRVIEIYGIRERQLSLFEEPRYSYNVESQFSSILKDESGYVSSFDDLRKHLQNDLYRSINASIAIINGYAGPYKVEFLENEYMYLSNVEKKLITNDVELHTQKLMSMMVVDLLELEAYKHMVKKNE